MTHVFKNFDSKYFSRWEKVKDDVIPKNAISGGNFPTGETIYVGRGKISKNR